MKVQEKHIFEDCNTKERFLYRNHAETWKTSKQLIKQLTNLSKLSQLNSLNDNHHCYK